MNNEIPLHKKADQIELTVKLFLERYAKVNSKQLFDAGKAHALRNICRKTGCRYESAKRIIMFNQK